MRKKRKQNNFKSLAETERSFGTGKTADDSVGLIYKMEKRETQNL